MEYTCGSQSRRALGCILGQLGVVDEIYMSKNNFKLVEGTGIKFCRMMESI